MISIPSWLSRLHHKGWVAWAHALATALSYLVLTQVAIGLHSMAPIWAQESYGSQAVKVLSVLMTGLFFWLIAVCLGRFYVWMSPAVYAALLMVFVFRVNLGFPLQWRFWTEFVNSGSTIDDTVAWLGTLSITKSVTVCVLVSGFCVFTIDGSRRFALRSRYVCFWLVGTVCTWCCGSWLDGDLVHFAVNSAIPRNLPWIPAASTSAYPYKHTNALGVRFIGQQPPNIVLVQVESLAGQAVYLENSGIPVAPHMARIAREGAYFPKCFAASTHTIRGQEALILSLPPGLLGVISVHYPKLTVNGLPTILKRAGYTTRFYQGHPHLDFMNTLRLMDTAGFDTVEVPPVAKSAIWGWGVSDRLLFQYGLDRIADHRKTNSEPVFVMFSTISSHRPFDTLPERHRFLRRTELSEWDHYCNAVHFTDECIGELMDRLDTDPAWQNTVLIVTSDHSVDIRPTGEPPGAEADGYTFSIPLIIRWPGVVSAMTYEKPVSQLDVAPTILELAGLIVGNHFVGESVFSAAPRRHPIMCFQPGGEGYQYCIGPSNVLFRSISTGLQGWLDPSGIGRWKAVDRSIANQSEVSFLIRGMEFWDNHQELIRLDRVWPSVPVNNIPAR